MHNKVTGNHTQIPGHVLTCICEMMVCSNSDGNTCIAKWCAGYMLYKVQGTLNLAWNAHWCVYTRSLIEFIL